MVARLRTSAGCLNCRQRRKKCGEETPGCQRCARANLYCTYSNAEQVDRRRRAYRTAATSKRSDDTNIETPFTKRTNGLLLHDVELVLPLQYLRPRLDDDFVNTSYIAALCRQSSLVRKTVAACTSMSVSEVDADKIWELYTDAITEMSARLIENGGNGSDEIIAAAVWLCVFETSRFEGGLRSGVHLKALADMLLVREPLDPDIASAEEMLWERMCVESLIYQSTVTTLLEERSNAAGIIRPVIERYCDTCTPRRPSIGLNAVEYIFRSPTLGGPPEMFQILTDALELGRRLRPLSLEEEISVWTQYSEICTWERILDAASVHKVREGFLWMGKPYAIMARITLIHVLCTLTSHPWQQMSQASELEVVMRDAYDILDVADSYLIRAWSKYLLWPLAIIGAVVLRRDKIDAVQEILKRLEDRGRCSTTTLIRTTLEKIWSRRQPQSSQGDLLVSMDGLRTILSQQTLAETAESLMSQ